MVLGPDKIDAIYRLRHGERWSLRRVARELHVSRDTVLKYQSSPVPAPIIRQPRKTKLDVFKPVIRELVDRDPEASAVVLADRLRPLGYNGGLTILRMYLKTVRQVQRPQRAFVRVESSPGDRFEIDWGHFGSLEYQGDKRKLYAFSCIECHSRRLYAEFTQSQSFETLVRCHIHAFRFMGGRARECCLFDHGRGNPVNQKGILFKSYKNVAFAVPAADVILRVAVAESCCPAAASTVSLLSCHHGSVWVLDATGDAKSMFKFGLFAWQ